MPRTASEGDEISVGVALGVGGGVAVVRVAVGGVVVVVFGTTNTGLNLPQRGPAGDENQRDETRDVDDRRRNGVGNDDKYLNERNITKNDSLRARVTGASTFNPL